MSLAIAENPPELSPLLVSSRVPERTEDRSRGQILTEDPTYFSSPENGAFNELIWFVVQVKSRQEKKLAWFCLNSGIPYFLPMSLNRTASRNLVLNCLFDGFLFVAAPKPPAIDLYVHRPSVEMLATLKATKSVFGFIFTREQDQLRKELFAMSQVKARDRNPELARFVSGIHVRVVSGPFAGLCGTVDTGEDTRPSVACSTPENHAKVVFDLAIVGRKYAVVLDIADLEVIPPTS
jgi:transcription antitermination factor NusG